VILDDMVDTGGTLTKVAARFARRARLGLRGLRAWVLSEKLRSLLRNRGSKSLF